MSSSLLSKLFHFVLLITKKYNIDESHGLSHSMNILHFTQKIYNDELEKTPIIKDQEKIIYVSSILHDMCDKKYVSEEVGINEIVEFLHSTDAITPLEIVVVKKIIQTMSYSTVKKYGFPQLNEYQPAYHIVREADLLTAYDFDRCMVYDLNKKDSNIGAAFEHANNLFENRVFKHDSDGLLLTDYAKTQHYILQSGARQRIKAWRSILTNKKMF